MTPAQRVSALLDDIDRWATVEATDGVGDSLELDALRHLVEALDRLVCGTADPTAAGWADAVAALVEPHVSAAAQALDLFGVDVALDRGDRAQTISLDGGGSDAR